MCIQPGDFYEGRVYASDSKGLYTMKMHEFPKCEYPEEPEFSKELEGIEKVVEEIRNAA